MSNKMRTCHGQLVTLTLLSALVPGSLPSRPLSLLAPPSPSLLPFLDSWWGPFLKGPCADSSSCNPSFKVASSSRALPPWIPLLIFPPWLFEYYCLASKLRWLSNNSVPCLFIKGTHDCSSELLNSVKFNAPVQSPHEGLRAALQPCLPAYV